MEFRILGPLEVIHDGQAVPLGGAKQRALLAVLLLHANRVVSTDRLMDDLWGEDLPDTAVNTVQVYVSQLRKILGVGRGKSSENMLITQKPGYLLRVGRDRLDLARFERLSEEGREALLSGDIAVASVKLRDSLAMWRGTALADFAFEPFAQSEIERLDEIRLATLENRIDADLGLGRQSELVGELEALVKEHPLRERFRGQLMLALYRGGRQAQALTFYKNTMRVFADELGLDPGPSLQRLHGAILRQDPELELPTLPVDGVTSKISTALLDVPLKREGASSVDELDTTDGRETHAIEHGEGDIITVTALFADIVGSTALAEQLSPEEVRAIMGECVSRLSQAVEDFGGMVQAYLGDGIAAYFGLPEAHEDDVARAARAALKILHLVEDYGREVESAWGIPNFNVRVGLNTGRIAVGTVGASNPQEVAFGDPLNIAARLQALAEPGTIALGDEVVKRLTSGFAFEPLGDLRVKGRQGKVNAWRLAGEATPDRVPPATPLVGRDAEMSRLARLIEELEGGRGRVLLVSGEAGIGKTRMLAELRTLTPEGIVWLEGRCLAYAGELPYGPFAEVLRGWLGVGPADTELAVRTKLHARLESLLGAEAERLLPYLCRLLSVQLDPRIGEPLDLLSPSEFADGLRRSYGAWIEGLCVRQPVVLALEDLHGMDAATRQLAEGLLGIADAAPLLLALTMRPDTGTEGWRFWLRALADYKHRTVDIPLEPLSIEAAGQLADALSPTGAFDPASKTEILARAEGNPLYLEELLRAHVEVGGVERRTGWTLSVTAIGRSLPPPLESLLVTRIQRLPKGSRRVAQFAAVIGREFSLLLLEQVAGSLDLSEDLAVLLHSEVIRELRRQPQTAYTFHHRLMQEAALSTLSPQRARELYGRVASAFEEIYAGALDERLELLAFYSYRSDAPQKALDYLERAGERAALVDAPVQAAELWERARRIAGKLADPEAEERLKRRLASLQTAPKAVESGSDAQIS